MNNIILTSSGFSNPEIVVYVEKFFEFDLSGKKVAVVTTASEEKEKNEFAVLADSQLKEMGFGSVIFFDIENQDPQELMDFDVIYVNGGNTYRLLYFVKKSGFERVIKEFLKEGGLYIGVSAGSIIAGPSIEVLNYTKGDLDTFALVDLSAMRFLQKAIVPHYVGSEEGAILEYENASDVKVVRLADDTALIGNVDGGFELIK